VPASPVAKMADMGPAPDAVLTELHGRISHCRSCVEVGLLARAAPVLPAALRSSVVLVGQAPGRVEEGRGRPFSGRAGRQLFRWLAQAGAGDERQARSLIYLTSITKCFPGPAPSGAGDRRPSAIEVGLCRPHLDAQLDRLRPNLVLAVGQLAITRFLGSRPMGELVGRLFDGDGTEIPIAAGAVVTGRRTPLILPLPHPSGASRWLNQEGNRALLLVALERLRSLLSDTSVSNRVRSE
jgi:uracil-DNA glycosylase